MEILRIPTKFGKSVSRLSSEERGYIFSSLFSMALGEDIVPADDQAGDLLSLIWYECERMDKFANIGMTNGHKGGEFGKLGGRPKKEITPPEGLEITPKGKGKGKEKENTDTEKTIFSENPLLDASITDWMEYKSERKEKYISKGLKGFLSQCHKYTYESVISQIEKAISRNWVGVRFEDCEKIPDFSKEFDFSKMPDKNEIWSIVSKRNELMPQLKFQNPGAYQTFARNLNILEQYGQ